MITEERLKVLFAANRKVLNTDIRKIVREEVSFASEQIVKAVKILLSELDSPQIISSNHNVNSQSTDDYTDQILREEQEKLKKLREELQANLKRGITKDISSAMNVPPVSESVNIKKVIDDVVKNPEHFSIITESGHEQNLVNNPKAVERYANIYKDYSSFI